MAQHHDAVGDLGHDGEVVADVERRAPLSSLTSLRIAASTSICVVTSSAVVGSSKTIRSGFGRHRHRGHGPLQLAAGNLVRIALAECLG